VLQVRKRTLTPSFVVFTFEFPFDSFKEFRGVKFDGDEFENNEKIVPNNQPHSEAHNKQMTTSNIDFLWTYQYMHQKVRSSPFLAF
jgi:hypothetical protein